MDYRFLGIAWPSPVTVDLLLCTLRLLYENVSTETSKNFFSPSLHIFKSTKTMYRYGFLYLQCLLYKWKSICEWIRFIK